MKTKFSKRILSMLLAVLMLSTSCPAYAALDDVDAPSSSGLVGSYLSKDVTTGIATNNNVVWSEEEHAAYFSGNESYLILEGAPMKTATVERGFAVSFDYKRAADTADNARFFDFNAGTSENSFALNCGSQSQNNWRRLMTLAKVDNIESSYYANDFGNESYCAYTTTAFPPEEKADTWYNITVSMSPEGEYSYYIDGVLRGTFKSNYDEEGVSNGVVPTTITESLAKMTNYLVGTSIYQTSGVGADGYYHGYLKNLKLFDSAVTPTQAFAGNIASDIDTLKGAIDEYESRMDGTVYWNMGPAYEAYQAACKAYDSYHYGNNALVDIVTPAQNLATAAMKMHAWVNNVSANAVPNFSNGNVADGYYSNLLYAGPDGDPADTDMIEYFSGGSGFGGSNGSFKAKLHTKANAVLLYDGKNTAAFPVTVEGVKSASSGINAKTINVKSVRASTNNSSWELYTNWIGAEADWNNWPSNSVSMGYVDGDSSITHEFSGGAHTFIYGNVLRYKGTGNISSYYDKFDTSNNIFIDYTINGGVDAWNDTTKSLPAFRDTALYVINYKALADAMQSNSKVLGDVSKYKEGGLASIISAFDKAIVVNPAAYDYASDAEGQVKQCAGDIQNAINAFQIPATPDNESNYPALRNAFNYEGTIAKFVENGINDTYTVEGAYNGGTRKGFDKASYNAFVQAYLDAQKVMSPVASDGYVQGNSAAQKAQALMDAFNALEPASVLAPTITEGCYRGPEDTIVITNNEPDSVVWYSIQYDDGTSQAPTSFEGESIQIQPFGGATTHQTATVKAYSLYDGDQSFEISSVFNLLNAPVLSVRSGQALKEYSTVSLRSGNTEAGIETTLQYSYDNEKWFDYTDPIIPFSTTEDTSISIYAREVYNGATSAVTSAMNLVMSSTFGIYSSTGNRFYYSDSVITMADLTTYGSQEIKYKLRIDGKNDDTVYTYDKEKGIVIADSDVLKNARIVRISAYPESQADMPSEWIRATFYNGDKYSPLAYQESFDGASISGTTFNTNPEGQAMSNTVNGTLTAAGTAEIVKGAGEINVNGESPDWRNNVLKINQNDTAPGNKITMASNPLANPNCADLVQANGATISFWRHIEDASGNTIKVPKEWLNGLTFQTPGNNTEYLLVETNGIVSRSDGASGGEGDYVDVKPEYQDPTQHAAGNDTGNWMHVVVAIDPEKGVTVYTNGEPHNVNILTGGRFTGNNAELAQDILAFLSDSNTQFTLCNGVGYEGNNCNLFLDDIRLYSTVLTQVQVNEMYTDVYADVQTSTSTAHDPTAVTAYTLTDGRVVGTEFLEKNNISSEYIAEIDYYIFGTGMTVYHSNDNVNWEVLGDSEGRCGYQNEDLFGDVYTTALAQPLAHAKTDEAHAGAGYLVWAPHVIYNVSSQKWCYYGSTSSWGSQISAIFFCEADDITGPYEYKQIIYQSNGAHPNAIDPCVYYDSDFSHLYMVFGSWGGENAIYCKQLNAHGDTMTNYDPGHVICYGINGDLEASSDGSSGEGAYVAYEKSTGYYYLYVSFGQNTGSYTERVFRSSSPDGGFVDFNGISATDNTTPGNHGDQILSPFDIEYYDYKYASTGHNSVYKATNKRNERVTVNSAHARPFANAENNWIALEDGALATRQSEVTGNVSLQNLLGYTQDGWPVLFALPYNGTDTYKAKLTMFDLEGVYIADNMGLTVNYSTFTTPYRYYIVARSNTRAQVYGTYPDGTAFSYNATLSTGADGTNYFNLVSREEGRASAQGALATQMDASGTRQVMLSYIRGNGERVWSYRTDFLPDANSESAGDIVTSDDVIYTHEKGGSYAKYGQEISDDFTYGEGTSRGERCTKITVKYPYYIDHNNYAAIYSMTSQSRAQDNIYTGADLRATPQYEGLWVYNNPDDPSGASTCDDGMAQTLWQSANEEQRAALNIRKVYTLTGTVSDYFAYDEKQQNYRTDGVTLMISYKDITDPSAEYGEYEFCYVQPNPSMAHTVVGIRNTNNGNNDKRVGTLYYSRLVGSEGDTSNSVISDLTYLKQQGGQVTKFSSTGAPQTGTGMFKFNGKFGFEDSVNYDYSTPEKIKDSFEFFSPSEGVNGGSYGSVEIDRNTDSATTMTAPVVEADYYIDYSNPAETLITRDASGTPTGYKFEFRVANLKWANKTNPSAATSYMRNDTGLQAEGVLDAYDSNFVSGWDSTLNGYRNEEVLGYGDAQYGRKVMSGAINDPSYDDPTYVTGLQKVFEWIGNGGNGSSSGSGDEQTNAWRGSIYFSGKESLAHRTDTSSAEKYANFIYEKGVYHGGTSAGVSSYSGNEAYSYYNIGVSVCDKGAVRYFAENFLNKTLDIQRDEDGDITSITATGDIESGKYLFLHTTSIWKQLPRLTGLLKIITIQPMFPVIPRNIRQPMMKTVFRTSM